MLVPDDDKDDDRPTIACYPRCEAGETLRGGYCELPGEVGFKGLLLCEHHARQIEAQDQIDLLEGIVSCLDLSLRSIPLRRNGDLSVLGRALRAQATRELARAREDLAKI